NNGPEPVIPTGEARVSGTLPVLYIETEGHLAITSKKEYVNASYRLVTTAADSYEDIGSEESPLPMQIRGRGHSSWKSPKKPYKIKLGKKTEIMGMAASKHWALIKPAESNAAGYYMAKLAGMAWAPDLRPVEVVLNGDYIGLYFLTETVRIDKNRVDIYEQEDGETDPDLIQGGWLVEVDNYIDECQINIPENSMWNMTVKYHSPENLSYQQKQWLKDEFTAMNAAVYNPDKTSTDWEKYIDVAAMARYFIIQEVMDNPDGFHGSFYLHKDLGDGAKWVAGPVWDLVCYNRQKTDYTFEMTVHYNFIPHWIGEIICYENFCAAVREQWRAIYPGQLNKVFGYIDSVVLPLEAAWRNDCARWNDDPSQTASLRAERLKTSLRNNMEWFDAHLPVAR
ncbi:MAG: CotH kinase family protein, partial [Muribaculaceae bacterium]|nr:CotH kinase family protein [Muribaculaceae bacterium]